MPDWKKTQAGRIVYARRRHPFSEKDALRIVSKLEAPLPWEFRRRWVFFQIWGEIIEKIGPESLFEALGASKSYKKVDNFLTKLRGFVYDLMGGL